MQAAGFVLVGGRSSRMGRDKALLPMDAHALVENVAARVREVAGNVALVGRPERYEGLGFECLPDLRADLGPLAGIEAALASGRGEFNLILACDMPEIERGWLIRLLQHAKETQAPCTIARDQGEIVHPLCGVYRRDCLPTVQRALDERRLRALELIEELTADFIDIGALIPNLNTPEDWTAWRQHREHRMHTDAS